MSDLDAYLAGIALGDVDAFGAWVARAEPPLRESLRSFAAVVDTEAVLQEALLRLWQVAPRLVSDGRFVTLWREADFGREADAETATELVAEVVAHRVDVLGHLRRLPGDWRRCGMRWTRQTRQVASRRLSSEPRRKATAFVLRRGTSPLATKSAQPS